MGATVTGRPVGAARGPTGDDTPRLLSLARLALSLGEEARATTHPDGTTPESVATHTAMLGLVALDVARSLNAAGFRPLLDLGLVAQLGLVHDLAEVAPGGPGDLNTYSCRDAGQLAAQKEAEAAAIARLMTVHPYIGWLAHRYELQVDAEAQLVHYLDKMLPKLTLILSGRAQWKRDGTTPDDYLAFVRAQRERLRGECPLVASALEPMFVGLDRHVLGGEGQP